MHERHLVDESLVAHILVVDVGGRYALALISEDVERVGGINRGIVEDWHQCRVKRLVEEDGLVCPLGHAAAIICHDVAIVGTYA